MGEPALIGWLDIGACPAGMGRHLGPVYVSGVGVKSASVPGAYPANTDVTTHICGCTSEASP